ncbi:MAG: hypothetical protein WD038_00265 [Balneolales bacterium]
MPSSRIRNIFIFFLIYLPVQYGVVGILGYYHTEPWPAFVFPGFKSIYDGEQGITVSSPQLTVTFADSSNKTVRVQDLLADAPFSHHRAIMSAQFSPQAIEDIDSGTKAWIYARLTSIAEKSNVLHFAVEWKETSYHLVNEELVTDSQLISRDIIHFDE